LLCSIANQKGRILKRAQIDILLFKNCEPDGSVNLFWRTICSIALSLSLLLILPQSALAQETSANQTRHALIIANSDYDACIGRLRNPINDARLIAGALGRAGFAPANVRVVENQDQRQMQDALLRFADRLRSAGPNAVGFLYYAGHGVQREGVNYLLPVRENLPNGPALRVYAVSLDRDVFGILREASKTLFVVIDACRDTPSAFRSGTRGLAMPTDTQGIVVAFSTEPGRVAQDGDGTNSPFATALAEALPKPGVEAATLLRDVRRTVQRKTNNAQMPHITEGLSEDFYFVPAVNIATPLPRPVVPSPVQLDALSWQGAMAANTKAAFEEYLARYPSGQFATLARQNVRRFVAVAPVRTVPTPVPDQTRTVFTAERWGLTERDFSVLSVNELMGKARFTSRIEEFRSAALNGDPYAMVILGNENRNEKGISPNDAESVRLFRLAAEAGNPSGMASLGGMLVTGTGVVKNYTEALRWNRAAAEAGNATGMVFLGIILENGLGTPKNDTEAVKWYRAAAEAGNATGMSCLGFMLLNGRGIAKNDLEALRWFRAAAEMEDALGMGGYGFMLESGRGVTKNEIEAVGWTRAAAERGHTDSMTNLAGMLADGRGVTKNATESVRWYRAAAEAGDARGMTGLGLMPANGSGVTKDEIEAVRWTRAAADVGNTVAMNNLGFLLANGSDIIKNETEAARWYRAAAEAGETLGMRNLGIVLQAGEGVTKNEAEAARWYKSAADRGDTVSMYNLGTLLESGIGVAQDRAEAVRWYRLAAEAGFTYSMINLAYMLDWGRGTTRDPREALRWARAGLAESDPTQRTRAQALINKLTAEGVR
jgi:TPR repeat protein